MGEIYRDIVSAQALRIGDRNSEIFIISNEGAPSQGPEGTGYGFTGRGSLYIDSETGSWYKNLGTKDSLQWKLIEAGPENEADTVTLAGEQTINSDNEPVTETYTATLDEAIAGVPITLSTSFLEADIDAVNIGSVEDFVGDGIEVLTDGDGEVEFTVTFASDVNKTENLEAEIDDTDPFVATGGDTNTLEIVVDTTAN